MKRCPKLLSIVVPAFNEAANIDLLISRIRAVPFVAESYEVVLVDDGSTDGTLEIIKRLAADDARIRYISLARNFGHQAALRVGLESAAGDVVVTLDADLQHPPELIPEMIDAWSNDTPVVNMLRRDDGTGAFKLWTSRWYYRTINWISDCKVEAGSSDFRLLDRTVVDIVCAIPEKSAFLRGLIPWLGFRQVNLTYAPAARHAGQTKYNVGKMARLALNGITSSSLRPLHLTTFLGAMIAVLAVSYAVYAIYVRLFVGTALPGWASLLAGIMLLGGVQLLMLGILGEYLGQVLTEVKDRPTYVVKERSDDADGSADE